MPACEQSSSFPGVPETPQSSVMNARRLFDHLVCATEQRQRHSNAERLGGLEVQQQFDSRGLLLGIVVVAAFAASAAGVLVAAITATWRRTRSEKLELY